MQSLGKRHRHALPIATANDARLMRGNVLKLALNFIRFVCKKLEKLPSNGVGYQFGKVMVLDHACDVEFVSDDVSIGANKLVRGLMMKVSTRCGPSDEENATRAFRLLREPFFLLEKLCCFS